MVSASKILTVSYGTFSCTLEGFDEPFSTMKAIAEYFRDLAADDRYFGAEPPVPDAEMLHRIAEREIHRRVEAKIGANSVVLRQTDAPEAAPVEAPVTPVAPQVAAVAAAPVIAEVAPEIIPEPVPEPVLQAPAVPAAPVAEAAPEPTVGEAALNGNRFDIRTFQRETATAPELPAAEAAVDMEPAEPAHAEPAAVAPSAVAASTVDDEESVAAKLMRIRAAVAQNRDAAPSGYSEDEHADEFLSDGGDFGFSLDEADTHHEGFDIRDEEAQPVAYAEDEADIAKPAEATDDAEFTAFEALIEPEDETIAEAGDTAAATAIDWDDEAVAEVDDEDVADESEGEDEAVAPDEDVDDIEAAFGAEDFAAVSEGRDTDLDDDAYDTSALAAALGLAPVQEAPAVADTAQANAAAEADEISFGSEDTDADDDFADADEGAAQRITTALRRARARVVRVRKAEIAAQALADEALADDDLADDDIAEHDLVEDEIREALTDAPTIYAEDDDQDFDFDAFRNPAETAQSEARAEAEDGDANADHTSLDAAIGAVLSAQAGSTTDEPAATSAETDFDEDDFDDFEDDGEADEARALPDHEHEEEVERLLEATNSQLEGQENRRRFSAISHLKAAVAATVADRKLKSQDGSEGDQPDEAAELERYREDLARAVRPRRPSAEGAATPRPAEPRPAPLVLVSEQRIDRPKVTVETAVIRPRRISASAAVVTEDDEDEADFDAETDAALEDSKSFIEFAERMGANSLSDLLEAAAAYTATVEGRPHFSRPQIMKKVARASDDEDFNREDGLRSFGMLLRQGKIQKIKRGQFTIASSSKFMAESRRTAR